MAPLYRDRDEEHEDANAKYHESDDEDFQPDDAPAEEPTSSSDEDEDEAIAQPIQRKGKRKAPVEEELDSGDEVTIKAARKRKTKKQKKGDNDEELILSDDEGGDGGLVKTRAQRKGEARERRPLARTEGATVDVDALWAQMTAAPLKPVQPILPKERDTRGPVPTAPPPAPIATKEGEDLITVQKTYTFAGQDTTESKRIPRSTLDTHLSQGWSPISTSSKPLALEEPSSPKANTSKIRRPLRRPSRFDPNPTGHVRALAPEHQLTYPRTTPLYREDESALMPPPDLPRPKPDKAQKLNVVDKSRMDWTGFVTKEGIAEELDTHGKTKEAYLGRMEFLAGVEARTEEERKRVGGRLGG
jgi:hypothetical protein